MNLNETLIRCSSFHKLFVEPRGDAAKKKGELSETAKTELKSVYRQITTGRRSDINSKYLEHGIYGEDFAITMLSVHLGKFMKCNTERVNNEYITGEPDVYIGSEITKAKLGFDTKCSWSIETFPFRNDELKEAYYWQNMGYMWLTGAEIWTTAYCLVNHSAQDITGQKLRLWNKLGCDNSDKHIDKYIKGAIEIEKNSIYDKNEFLKYNPNYDFDCKDWQYDLPMNQRIRLFPVERDETAIEQMKAKVIKAREYLQELHETEGEITPIQIHDSVNDTKIAVHDSCA